MNRSAENDPHWLRHMLQAALEARTLIHGQSLASFSRDRVLQLAVDKLIQNVGESASQVTRSFQNRHSQIEWARMIAMRNRLVHVFFKTDLFVLWRTVTENLPPLITELEAILSELDES